MHAGSDPYPGRASRFMQASTDWEGRDRTYNLRFQGPPRCQLRHSPTRQGERPELNRRHPDSQTGASTDWATLTMLPPRFELGSRADQALAGYKPAAFPVKLQERIGAARLSERFFIKSAPTGTRTRTLRRSGADTSSSCRSPNLSYRSRCQRSRWVWWDSNPHFTD